jgi:hypothetical protein
MSVPHPARAAAAAVFGGLSTLRRRRSLHPDGASYHAAVHIDGDTDLDGAPLLAHAASHPALVRFSRGAGLPPSLPDVLGLALRLCDVHGEGRHQDLLMATSAKPPVLHHLLLPGVRGPFGQPYSTILPYRAGNRIRLFGALPLRKPAHEARSDLEEFTAAAARGEARFTLAVAAPFRGWRRIGSIDVGAPLGEDVGERLRFNPWNTGGGLQPAGPFQGLRDPAYSASQRARLTT